MEFYQLAARNTLIHVEIFDKNEYCYLAKQFFKSTTIRKTKTDKVDARLLSSMLASIDYKALHTKYYHINKLKALTRTSDSLISDRFNYQVQITNALDNGFHKFKHFFKVDLV